MKLINKKNRQGSMSLGVNSIVILIIAVIVLGLVIGFINQMFSNISKKINLPDCTPQSPSGSDPVTLCPSPLIASPGEDVALNVMVFNTQTNKIIIRGGYGGTISIDCTDSIIDGTINLLQKTIQSGESGQFSLTFKIKGTVGKGTYICRLNINNIGEKDFKVEIR